MRHSAMTVGVENQVLQALMDTLQAYLPAKLPNFPRKVTWTFENEFAEAQQCPIVAVVCEDGTKEKYHTIRGLNQDGSVAAGGARQSMAPEIMVWLTGRQRADLLEEMRKWQRAIVAVIEDNWDLGTDAIDCNPDQMAPMAPIPSGKGSDMLTVGVVRLRLEVATVQGNLSLS